MKRVEVVSRLIIPFFASMLMLILFAAPARATTLESVENDDKKVDITVGQDADGNVTVTYDKHVFTRKYNGWYIPSAYIYDGSDLDIFLDARVAYTRRTSVRYDGFLFLKMSGGWYRHELHINDGRALANVFNEAAGITSTYDPDKRVVLPAGMTEAPSSQPEAGQ